MRSEGPALGYCWRTSSTARWWAMVISCAASAPLLEAATTSDFTCAAIAESFAPVVAGWALAVAATGVNVSWCVAAVEVGLGVGFGVGVGVEVEVDLVGVEEGPSAIFMGRTPEEILGPRKSAELGQGMGRRLLAPLAR